MTDDPFDEIATKVLNEDDLNAGVGQNVVTSNHKPSASPLSTLVVKASAKVLVPVKAKESENDDVSEKSSSSFLGDVLGLGNYASDADDGNDEIKSFGVPTSEDAAPQSGIKEPLEDMQAVADNNSHLKLQEQCRSQINLVNNPGKTSSIKSKTSIGAATGQLPNDQVAKELDCAHPSKGVFEDRDNELNTFEKGHERSSYSSSNGAFGITKSELPGNIAVVEKENIDHPGRESRTRSDKMN